MGLGLGGEDEFSCIVFHVAQLPVLPDHDSAVPERELFRLQQPPVFSADWRRLRCILCERLCHTGDMHDE